MNSEFRKKCLVLSQSFYEIHNRMNKLENEVFMYVNRPLQLHEDVSVYGPFAHRVCDQNAKLEWTHSMRDMRYQIRVQTPRRTFGN